MYILRLIRSASLRIFQRKYHSVREVGEMQLKGRGEEPMVIIMTDGGLCSAITKYVLGECFRKHFGFTVKYDLTWYDVNGKDCDGKGSRAFTLNHLFPHLEFDVATQEEIAFYKRHFYHNNTKPYWYDADIFNIPQPLYFDGYAENWRYVAEVEAKILSELRFGELELNAANAAIFREIIQADFSIAVHVRRGDYVNLGMAMLGEDYYISAIETIVTQAGEGEATVFFFSDDINWVREYLVAKLPKGIKNFCVDVNGVDEGHFDLFLISQCDHQVSSNSSFGYWGGLLNRNPQKKVIIPSHWLPGEVRGPELAGCDTAHDYPGFEKQSNFPNSLQPMMSME